MIFFCTRNCIWDYLDKKKLSGQTPRTCHGLVWSCPLKAWKKFHFFPWPLHGLLEKSKPLFMFFSVRMGGAAQKSTVGPKMRDDISVCSFPFSSCILTTTCTWNENRMFELANLTAWHTWLLGCDYEALGYVSAGVKRMLLRSQSKSKSCGHDHLKNLYKVWYRLCKPDIKVKKPKAVNFLKIGWCENNPYFLAFVLW